MNTINKITRVARQILLSLPLWGGLGWGVLLTSCEKELPVWDDPQAYLNFFRPAEYEGGDLISPIINYSFVYHKDLQQDTVWLDMQTMGLLPNVDRPFKLKQVQVEDTENAQPGVDYVPFDDPSLTKFYVAPAGKADFKIPVVLKRNESLKTTTKKLRIELQANEYFLPGYDDYKYRIIEFTDQLAKPSLWDVYYIGYYVTYDYSNLYFYSTELHQFMIDLTGFPWDDDFIQKTNDEDSSYFNYLLDWCSVEWAKYQAGKK